MRQRYKLRFKVWKDWYKKCMNGRVYKILVLFGLVNSPTFDQLYWCEKYKDSIYGTFYNRFLRGCESDDEPDRSQYFTKDC